MDDETKNFLQFRICVIEAKHLKSRDNGGSSDPFVSVQVFDEIQSTSIIYDSMNCTWDKSFFFEFKDMIKCDVNTGKISFNVYDANTWKRNTIIGCYDVDISYVLENKISNQWVVLSDPTDTYEGTQGFLHISVSVIKQGEIVEYENRYDENKCNELLLPINIQRDEYCLIFILHCIDYEYEENLLVRLKFSNGQKCDSSMVCHKNPIYNQELHLPVVFPSMSDIIEISVIASSANGLTEKVLCSDFLSISLISKHKERLPKWYHIYHSDLYMLSILANVYLKKVNTAKLDLFDIVSSENNSTNLIDVHTYEKQQHTLLIPRPYSHECIITCNLYECTNLIDGVFGKSDFSVEIWYKKNKTSSSLQNADKNKKIEWMERLVSVIDVEKSIKNQADIYIYLRKGKYIVGVHIIHLQDIVEIKYPQWITLGESNMLMSMFICKKTQVPKRDEFIKSSSIMYYFNVFIHQGIFDTYGDYHLELQINETILRSTCIKNRSICDWYEQINERLLLPNIDSLIPLLYIKLCDADKCIECIQIAPCDFDSITSIVFRNAVIGITLDLQSSRSCIHITKTIHSTYICRFVIIGIRNFKVQFLAKQLRLNINMNDEAQATKEISNTKNGNIFEIFDFIVNQYTHVQYGLIDIQDSTLYNKKIGECIIKIDNLYDTNNLTHENCNDNVERDDIPKYLENRKLLRGAFENYMSTPQPFQNWKIKNKHVVVGNLVGYTRIFNTKDTQDNILSHENEKSVFINEKVVVRVYILRCLNLIAKDITGSSDPYVKLSIGNDVKQTRVIKQSLCPEFHEVIEFKNVNIPNDGYVNISVYDWDQTSADDFIGSTYIDITNRWYHDEWVDYQYKPLELRTLHHKHASGPQGTIELWVDILTTREAKISKPVDISLPPQKQFVIRLIVWNAKQLACNDMNNMNDVYVSGIFDDIKQCTDIHWRASNRRANFNYRILWNIDLPIKKLFSKITIQVWDQDIIGESDLIGEGVIDMHSLFKQAYLTMLPQVYNHTNNKRDVWVELFHSDYPNISRGFVRVSLEIVSKFYAEQHPAGEGRDSPNINPTLQEPIRPSFQITRPLEMVADLLGDELYSKLRIILYGVCICWPFFICLWLWVQIKNAFGIKYSWE